MITKQWLMESSDETLILWRGLIQQECDRRQIGGELVEPHPGNAHAGGPSPLLVRVLSAAAQLPPSDLQKLDTLISGWGKERR